MMDQPRLTFTIALAAAALLVGGEALAQNRRRSEGPSDLATIITTRGRSYEDVRVSQLDFEEVRFQAQGSRPETIKGEDILEIRWQNAPGAYATGLSQIRAGLYERAVNSFTTVRNTSKEDWVKAYSTYWLAEAQRLLGSDESLRAAIEEYNRLLSNAPKHLLVPAAIYGLGEAQAVAGQHNEAKSTFGRLDSGYGDMWSIRGKLGEGEALLAAGRPADARGAFELARGRATSYPDLQRAAQVGIGEAYVLDKRWDDAVRFFDGIIRSSNVTPEVAAGAWVGKGDCRFEQGTAGGKNDPAALKEALIAYQTTVVRYAGVPGVYPKALYQSARIYRLLNLPQQAEHMERELKSRSPNSSWAQKLGQ